MSALNLISAADHPDLYALAKEAEQTLDSFPLRAKVALETALPLAQAIADSALLSILFHQLGTIHTAIANPQAIRDYESALDHAERATNNELIVDALHGLGRSFLTFGILAAHSNIAKSQSTC